MNGIVKRVGGAFKCSRWEDYKACRTSVRDNIQSVLSASNYSFIQAANSTGKGFIGTLQFGRKLLEIIAIGSP